MHSRFEAAIIKAADGTRTHDLVLTKDALYQLSYSSPNSSRASQLSSRSGCSSNTLADFVQSVLF